MGEFKKAKRILRVVENFLDVSRQVVGVAQLGKCKHFTQFTNASTTARSFETVDRN